MKKFLMFMLFLGLTTSVFALSDRDLARKAAEVQRKFKLTDWTVTIRFVTFQEMLGQNKCKCFGESRVFPKTKTAVVNILDDDGYGDLGWTNKATIHAHELFAVLHEVLHLFIEVEHPEFDEDTEEVAVRQLAAMTEHQPELK